MDEQIRRGGIGGSDIAAICGCDEFNNAFGVWASKTGRLSQAPPNARMKIGKYFERGIAEFYSELTKRPLRYMFDDVQKHPVFPWIIFTPDALCVDEPRGVDAKMVNWKFKHLWGETVDDIPARVQLQAHWYMFCTGFPVWDIAALVGDDEPRIYSVRHDPQIEEFIFHAAEEFWRKYVVADVQPPIGCSDASYRWLREHYPREKSPLIREATVEEVAVLEQYEQLRNNHEALSKEKASLENDLKQRVGDDAGIKWEYGKFTWKMTKDREPTDWKLLSHSLMNGRTQEEKDKLIEAFTDAKAGSRRMYFHSTRNKT